MSPHKDPARKRRIRSKIARLRRRQVPRAPADDHPVPPAEAPPSAADVPTKTARPPSTEPGGGTPAEPPPSGGTAEKSAPLAENDAPAVERPSRAGPGEVAAKPPPLPVRGASRLPADAGDDTSDNPAVPSPFPPMSPLSAEELLADQPSVEMLRRVRRGLRALPESDRHLPE
ncbi:hypothetical protein [Streptomyces sp. SP17KL33]|uniref:hypothetical protein n=1 Tax=Streptomyces sp. SP17KL33 TaxID=3002534 RepID=UPI002E7925F7|nr:hypothetical protein [Streptomyces sp. SP17KL33]MEE1833499.1 hypothetical protein [Streptomyces sp. SP17KL33]